MSVSSAVHTLGRDIFCLASNFESPFTTIAGELQPVNVPRQPNSVDTLIILINICTALPHILLLLRPSSSLRLILWGTFSFTCWGSWSLKQLAQESKGSVRASSVNPGLTISTSVFFPPLWCFRLPLQSPLIRGSNQPPLGYGVEAGGCPLKCVLKLKVIFFLFYSITYLCAWVNIKRECFKWCTS